MPNIEVKKKSISMNINAGKIYPPLENLEVNPTKEKQVFNHENSYGYDEVVVNPVILQDKTVKPIAEEQIIKADDGYNGLNEVTVGKIGQTPYKPRFVSFYQYSGTELDEELANLDTSNMTYMDYMFGNCGKLTHIDVSNFDTSNITTMTNVFYYCSYLQNVDLSSWDTRNNTTLYGLFYSCASLISVVFGKNFNTTRVNIMGSLFYNNKKLNNIDMSMFDMSKVTNVNNMFGNCNALTNLKFGYNLGQAYSKSSSGSSYDLYFTESPLTYESAMSVINNVYDCKANGHTQKRTITFKASTYNLLSADDIAIATNKGWTIASR
jgi:surface protein